MIDLETLAKRIQHYRWFANLRDRCRMTIQQYRELVG